jgi:hypothetical protein
MPYPFSGSFTFIPVRSNINLLVVFLVIEVPVKSCAERIGRAEREWSIGGFLTNGAVETNAGYMFQHV